MTDKVGGFLAHYGVKGMRWGVRHDRNEVDRAKPKEDRNKPDLLRSKFGAMTLADLKKLSAKKRKPENKLTDDEILDEFDELDDLEEGGD